jgi:hypothetical protein
MSSLRPMKPLPKYLDVGANRIASIKLSDSIKPKRFDWLRKDRIKQEEKEFLAKDEPQIIYKPESGSSNDVS